MSEPKVHYVPKPFRRLSMCGQHDLRDERIAQFAEDVTCGHCQRYASTLPARPTTRPAPGGPDE